jgi:S-disulfanyl-L-cysteine oxidoreductase SoxD
MIYRAFMAAATVVFTIGAATAAGPAFATATTVEQAPQKTTNSGVYTAAQAERGKKVFSDKCTACHEPARFSGATFLESWNGKAMKELWDVASGTMPEDNPGSLKQQEYGDILAYFLALNEYPAGETELEGNGAAMANIKVEPKK